jgi:ribonuclease BN (tRNA processing enzyme)
MSHRVCFTLDVLTDGSDFTGHSTIFLSVWKRPKDDNDDSLFALKKLKESMQLQAPLARYAIAGLGDATARLCADQRMKLAPTRAVFFPSSPAAGSGCGDGLTTVLLALHAAGAPSLHIVTPTDTDEQAIEELASLTLGTRRHMNIQTCRVPQTATATGGSCSWWKVYSDEYVTVHASCRDSDSDSDKEAPDHDHGVTYLYSTLQKQGDTYCTLALLPPRCRDLAATYRDLAKEPLPLLENGTPVVIDCVLALDPQSTSTSISISIDDPSAKEFNQVRFLVTLPNHNNTSSEGNQNQKDPGILIRSQQIANHFHDNMPWAFPSTNNGAIKDSDSYSDSSLSRSNGENTKTHPLRLRSCTSVILDSTSTSSDGSQSSSSLVVMDRRQDMWDRPLKSEEWNTTLESLQTLLPQPPSTTDENEIDLDDDDDDEDENDSEEKKVTTTAEAGDPSPTTTTDPQLIVLGTGCASPSAVRGASGYALCFPRIEEPGTTDLFLLDCGEGVTTMLSRNCRHMTHWASSIQGIWISHSHLDHYGGLPTLLRTIAIAIANRSRQRSKQEHNQQDDDETPSSKRPRVRLENLSVPWVMAPPKVLRFLDISLQCHHGRRRHDNQPLFHPRLHQDPTVPPGPWNYFQNIKVDHHCYPAYGLLLGWQPSHQQQQQWLCFSGDTRPCHSLVRACRQALVGRNAEDPLLLIHEATFQDEEQGEAERKMHSTRSEALRVAADIPATRVLLTHFSQRYVSLTPTTSTTTSTSTTATSNASGPGPEPQIPMGLAMDGLWLPL